MKYNMLFKDIFKIATASLILLTFCATTTTTSPEEIFYSGPSTINGTQGKSVRFTFTLLKPIPESEDSTVQWLKDGNNVDQSDPRFRFIVERNKGKLILEINPLHRSDRGNYQVIYGHVTSNKTFLNITEIPSSNYPKIELKINNDQVEVYCISEKTSPPPTITFNNLEEVYDDNDTYIWVSMTFPITPDMIIVEYTCTMVIARQDARYEPVPKLQITSYGSETTRGDNNYSGKNTTIYIIVTEGKPSSIVITVLLLLLTVVIAARIVVSIKVIQLRSKISRLNPEPKEV